MVLEKRSWGEYQYAEAAVTRFSSTIPSLSYTSDTQGWSQTFDFDYFVVQTIIYACFIHLQRDEVFDARAFKASTHIVRMMRQLNNDNYPDLDPMILVGAMSRSLLQNADVLFQVCWYNVCEMFRRVLANATSLYNSYPEATNIINACKQSLALLITTMKTFGALCPLSSTPSVNSDRGDTD